jgi:hypothetical protein
MLAAPSWAGALEDRLAACQEGFSDCREDCTTAYGSSFKLREQLGRCLNKCTRKKDDCRGRHIELDQAQIDEDSFERKRPGQELASEPERREVPAAPAPRRKPPRVEPQPERAGESEAEAAAPEAAPRQDGPARDEQAEPPAERTRAEAAPAPATPPARAAKARPAQEEAAPAAAGEAAEEQDPSREGAKKLMKRGIEEWDPNAEQ